MKKFNEYVEAMIEKCEVIKDELQDDFHFIAFSIFLTNSGERYYKNGKLLSFFKDIKSGVNAGTNKEEVKTYLTTTCQKYEKARLQDNPVNFSTNPMANLIRLWHFELLAEYIKHINIMLSKI